jgi:hypothetical protein
MIGISVLRRVRQKVAPTPSLTEEMVAEREEEVLEATR